MKYKYSQFNVFFKQENQIIGFNTFNQEIIVIDELLYELISSKDDINNLKNIHPDFYNFLIEKGFAINSKINELKNVKKLMASVDFDNSTYELIINPTMNCNFKCWYCYEEHIIKSALSKKIQSSIINHVNLILTSPSINQFHLSWFGGEPLLEYKKVIVPITKKIQKNCKSKNVTFSSGYTTNGLLIKQDMIPFFKQSNVINFQITLDGHKNRHNQVRYISKNKGSYDKILENIKLLISNDLFVTVRINYSEETLLELTEIANDFAKLTSSDLNNLEFSFNQVWQVKKNLEKEMIKIREYFNSLGLKITSKYDIDSVRNSCYADKKNQATINYNGDVFKCTARDFKKENREGVLKENGVILWNDKLKKRMNVKLSNKPCLTCSILPICGGGCTQNYIEMSKNGEEYCLYEYNESKKIEFVKKKVTASFVNQ